MLSLLDLHSQLDEALNINSTETVFSPLYYTDLINGQRELWLRNEYNKNRSIDPNLIQEIPCLEMELVASSNCCIPIPDDCKVLRSVEQVPNTIEFFFSKGIISVGPSSITEKRYTLIDYNRVPYVGNGRFNQDAIYAFLYDRYVYLVSKNVFHKMIKYINVRGLFTDPTALGSFISCENTPCWTPNDLYPINLWMWEYIKPLIIQQLLQKQYIPQDDANNTKDDKTEVTNGVS
jgi:hypothetical protein